MKSLILLAMFVYGVGFADDVYLKTGFVFRNVQVVDTVGTNINIRRDGKLLEILMADVERIEFKRVDSSVKSAYELYSQELSSQYQTKTKEKIAKKSEEDLIKAQREHPERKRARSTVSVNESSLSLALGYNFYTPEAGTRLATSTDITSYGGLVFAMRLLLNTPGIWSKLCVGLEYDLRTLATENSRVFYYVSTGEATTYMLNVHVGQLVADVKIFDNDKFAFHIMTGAGLLYDEETEVSRAGWSGSALVAIPLPFDDDSDSGWTFDLQVSTINSFSGMKVGTLGITGGVSIRF
jgi:hypothetical protein